MALFLIAYQRFTNEHGHSECIVSHQGSHIVKANKIVDVLWPQWVQQVFPYLMPFKNWKSEHRNLQVGDVVLVQYASKMSKGE